MTLAAVAPAAASTWQTTKLSDGPVQTILYGASCPSASLCVAVGANSTVATSTNPGGGVGAWSVAHVEEVYVPLPGTGPGKYLGNAIRGVSCPTTGFCAVAGPQGHIFTSTDPTGGAGAWSLAELGLEATHMYGVSCASPSLCVAVAQNGKVIASTNPAGGASAWTVTKLDGAFDLRAVSCPSTTFCAAVDLEGNILTSTDPAGGAAAWSVARTPAGASPLNGISCPSSSFCVTANPGQILSSTDPGGGAGAWQAVAAGSGLPVTALSCPSTTACAAVDNNADAIVSTDPTGPASSWSFTNVIPAPRDAEGDMPVNGRPNGMFGISCPVETLCVGVGQDRQIITSTDPFAAIVAKPPAAAGARRLKTTITFHPLKRVNSRKGGAKVTFRFRSSGAVGFKCKLSGRRLASCKSPVRYRVGRGNYVFRVFAIGPDEVMGHPASFRFRVGELNERPPIGTCKSGQESTRRHPCQTAR